VLSDAPNSLTAPYADSLGPDALHPSVRTAILAAHAALPGPALITPALRTLLSQPPESLPLP